MENNHVTVSKGFRVLLNGLAPYIARELEVEFGKDWWDIAVLDKLYDEQKRDLPISGDWAVKVDSLDIARCLLLFDLYWTQVFRKKLSIDHRTWAKELVGVRNKLAHIGGNDFNDDDTWRALDTMSRLCEQIDPDGAEEIRELLRELRYGSAAGSTKVTENNSSSEGQKTDGIQSDQVSGLPSWRDIIEPHPDVAQGRYRNAEFAADLSQVSRGEGAFEYLDPVEFFARTYVTEGMSGLLVQALKRVTGKDGEPVIQLKTAFGGGKTHSMLALYHIMRGRVSIDKIPNIKPVLDSAGIRSLPKANVAVLVGTALDPSKSRRPQNFPGITINTLWGEMAAQLAESAGKPELYDYVKEADKKGVSPGSVELKELFDAAGPCMILMDELVAYAKKLHGRSDLPAGTLDNFVTFIQEITEAARASKNSLVVASIPESDIEIGGDAGTQALEAIEHTFGRMESIWKPVAANEGFEVVRRRLFLDCKDEKGRDLVCSRFSQMYSENAADFPIEAKEADYKERMKSCYPIHPEVFDRLYEDWATLERFQRTRGVLRLMAAVIHELWMGNDSSPMIMPGSFSLNIPSVRDELTRHLQEGWNAIVDREVDGKKSVPYQTDQTVPRYGHKMAARRVARTIMLGSAPTDRAQAVKGIEAVRIRLGVVQPGDNIADFNDALSTLRSSLQYLYTNPSGDRYWYDTRPTLRKTAEDRAIQMAETEVELEIENRIKGLRNQKPFSGIHRCPSSSLDVSDDQTVRLCILKPSDDYKASRQRNKAIDVAEDILNNRGNSPRVYRNMLAFIAPDADYMASLKQAVRRYLAWGSIKNDSEDLNLDAAQNRETDNNLRRSNETVDMQMKEAYRWLLVPYIDKDVDVKTVVWDRIQISGGTEDIISVAAKKMIQNESLISSWAPTTLLMELDNVLWKDEECIQIKKLWEYLCTYCYLPRLSDYSVLENAIRNGVNSTEYFALAGGLKDDRYIDLKYNQYVGLIDNSAYIVKLVAALKQLAENKPEATNTSSSSVQSQGGPETGDNETGESNTPVSVPNDNESTDRVEPENKTFFMSADLDTTRINRDVQKLVEEVISHLSSVEGSTVEVSLEVNMTAPNGTPTSTVRTVTENCQSLHVRQFGFDD